MSEAFAAAGARLALVDIADCSDLASRIRGDHRSYSLDLTDPDAIAATVPRDRTDRGIDILINNAGLGMVAPAGEQSVADWDRTHAINLRAPWLMAAAALPFLKISGAGARGEHRLPGGCHCDKGARGLWVEQGGLDRPDQGPRTRMGAARHHRERHLAHRRRHADGIGRLVRRQGRSNARRDPDWSLRQAGRNRGSGALSSPPPRPASSTART